MKMIKEIKQLKQYFLGNLSEIETKEIDLAIISNNDLEESLIFAEEDLIEDYLDGELSVKEISLFNQNFLISSERRQHVKTIAQLKRYGKNLEDNNYSKDNNSDDGENFLQTLISSFVRQPIRAFGAILIIGFIGVFAWSLLSINSGESSILEREYAELNREDLKDQSRFDNLSKLVLINGKTRSDGTSKEVLFDNLSEKVLFNLALRTESKETETYQVKLINNGKIEFTQTNIRPVNNEFGEELRFFLPKRKLQSGQYQISVVSNFDSQNQLVFPFNVK